MKLYDFPLEIILIIIGYLNKDEINNLQQTSKSLRVALQLHIMPELQISITNSNTRRQGIELFSADHPVVDKTNRIHFCRGLQKGWYDYYLSSVVTITIIEKCENYRKLPKKYKEPKEPLDQMIPDCKQAFGFMSPEFLLSKLINLKKVVVNCGVSELASPFRGYGEFYYQQIMRFAANNNRITVEIDANGVLPNYLKLENRQVQQKIKHIELGRIDTTGTETIRLLRKLSNLEYFSLTIEYEPNKIPLETLTASLSSIKTLKLYDADLKRGALKNLENLEKLIVVAMPVYRFRRFSTHGALQEKQEGYGNNHRLKVKELVIEGGRGSKYCTGNVKKLYFPDLRTFTIAFDERVGHRNFISVPSVRKSMKILKRSKRLQELNIGGTLFIVGTRFDNVFDKDTFEDKVFPFTDSLRVINVDFYDSSAKSVVKFLANFPNLQVFNVYRRLKLWSFDHSCDLFKKLPKLAIVSLPINASREWVVRSRGWRGWPDIPTLQDDDEWKELLEFKVADYRTRGLELYNNWLYSMFGRKLTGINFK